MKELNVRDWLDYSATYVQTIIGIFFLIVNFDNSCMYFMNNESINIIFKTCSNSVFYILETRAECNIEPSKEITNS